MRKVKNGFGDSVNQKMEMPLSRNYEKPSEQFRGATERRCKSVRVAIKISLMLLIVFTISLATVHATEFGGSMYPGGNEDFMAGALPPPGLYYLNYFANYNLDSYRGNNGDKQPIDFKGDVTFNAFRLLYVSKKKLLGADVVVHGALPVINMHLSANTPGGHMSQTKTGLGDIDIGVFGLAWHWKNFHCVAGVDFNLPTGSYSKDDFVNPGRHYWNFEPLFGFTYLSDRGLEASAKIMYNFNTVNSATHYTSGQELGVDYLLGLHCGPWAYGINGYYYLQTTDDKYRGHKVKNYFPNWQGDGRDGYGKGRQLSIGPAIQYNYKNMFFNVKYQWDTNVKNKPEGSHLWLKFMYAF